MSKYNYQLIVIGSGAAGRAAAVAASKLGSEVAIIESEKWGGVDVNDRNIPYAAALNFAHLYATAKSGSRFGLSSLNLRFNYPTATNWRNLAIRRARANVKKELDNPKITCISGFAHFLGPNTISVGGQTITAEKFIIATGAVPIENGISGIDTAGCLTPNSAIRISRSPKSVFVIGAGSSGCEIAQYFSELNADVFLADLNGRILPNEDAETSQLMEKYFTGNNKIEILTKTRVVAVEQDGRHKKVVFIRGGQEKSVKVDAVVVATGTRPSVDLGLDNAGVKLGKSGIKVNSYLQTSNKNIWAIGDVIGGDESSTERAVYEAEIAIKNAIKKDWEVVDYSNFMRVINTQPQIAKIGLNEIEAKKRHKKIRTVIVSLSEVSVSNTKDFGAGFVKISVNHKGMIIGATAVMPDAALVLQEVALAINCGVSIKALANTPHIENEWSNIIKLAAKKLVK